ncbi:MAG: peptide chain release factor N(5)-glutamine methyltransferase [Blastocatellia bacterium]
MTIAETLQRASRTLRAGDVPNDLLDAQVLLAHALGCDRTWLVLHYNDALPEQTLAEYEALITRRAAREPLQYITGRQEFFGIEFEVTPAVLIPRPETELIVEEVIRLAQERAQREPDWRPVIIDVGTGSGCIAVTLARELAGICEGMRLIAVDISSAALAVARRNAARHGLASSVEFREMDLLDGFPAAPLADFILSNPPYIAAAEMPGLPHEVREWEPHLALTDHADGLAFYRRLLRAAPARLHPGGHLVCEIGYEQAEAIRLMLAGETIWRDIRFIEDLQSILRTMVVSIR